MTHLFDRSTDRRHLLQMTVAGGVASTLPAAAAKAVEPPARPVVAAPAMPIVDTRFPAEMAPGIFVLPDKRIPLVPNIGIIVGRDAVLVVDCGLGLESAEAVLKLARQLAPGRRMILTVTHSHPEHGFGAQVFKSDARIYYNRAQGDYFARSGAALLAGFRTGVLPPEQKHVLDGIILTSPHETYEGDRVELDLGGRKVAFRTWGTAHSPGDQVIHLPAEKIVFAGDLVEERMFPIVPLYPPMITATDIDAPRWDVALSDIVQLEPRLIVPGHGNLGGPEIASNLIDYFKQIRALVRASAGTTDGLADKIRSLYPTWEQSQFIGPAVSYFAQFRR